MDAVDVMIDFMRADLAGYITVRADKLPVGVDVNDYLVVGDTDAEPAVARVIDVRDKRATLRILPGSVDDNRDLLERPVTSAR